MCKEIINYKKVKLLLGQYQETTIKLDMILVYNLYTDILSEHSPAYCFPK